MAITNSGLFIATWMDILDTTQLAIDLDLETQHRHCLWCRSVQRERDPQRRRLHYWWSCSHWYGPH